MINKFRYRKPSMEEGEGRCDSRESTLTRKSKGAKLKVKDNGVALSSSLDSDKKKKIKELFSQLQFSPETALPPDALRRALAESFFDQQRFQLGFMDDAAECFENMLLRIHQHVAHGQAEDACAAPHCVPHQKFAMTLVEQAVCGNCGATSEPLSYTQMVHYVSTSTLVYQVRTNSGRQGPLDTFGKLLQKAGSMGDIRQCPSACGSVIQIGRTLMNHPEIVSVGLVWNSERPTLEHIMEVFASIGTNLRLGDVFNSVVDSRWAENSIHNLVGVVTYYGKHYSTFFFHTKLRVWIYFDDATVREVGPRWDQVVEKCRKGRYQPLLLLYASPDGTPVNTDNAPKQITPFYTDKTKSKPMVNQQLLRRSVTPSPEKPIIGNTRRAITPNPENSPLSQKPPLPRSYNEYQNLAVIQKNIYPPREVQNFDQVDGCLNKKEPDYVIRKPLEFVKPHVNVHRTLSNGSSSGVEGMPDHVNLPRRRDSGNWSGDRNSASSASSTTMENPYLYLVGKVPHGSGSVPGSPTRIKSDSSSGSSGVYDAGYDSYSLSSNDSSSMSTLQHLMKMGHLAKIPEDYSNVIANQPSLSCDVLCDEADELLVKSRQLEDEHDLVLALALCNAAATKARAAMNAPYNNPQTLTLARMKHNTCIMRARSLHRRMTQTQNTNKENTPEIRHTREGSSGSGRHSRQNSRDKGSHSRQNSRELLLQQEKEKPKVTKNIEIYATLPKKKDALKAKLNEISIEDAEYVIYDKAPERESRSIFSRSKNKDSKVKEKRSRSEDRHKISRSDFSIAPEIITGKDTLKKAKDNKDKEEKKDKDGKTKKQHKIRRKLLMGGLIKRKNRSMPDLTDANVVETSGSKSPPCVIADDSTVGLKGTTENQKVMTGYLSEGHLEFAGSNANPNLERSKLMRKSFHGSAGKILAVAKVPPPPPLRTTSQLSTSKLNSSGEVAEETLDNSFMGHYHNLNPYNRSYEEQGSMSLPYYHNNNSSYDDDSFGSSSRTVVTQADVHHEQSPMSNNNDSGVDEVDCMPSHPVPLLELPPYPSPIGSVIHSRQASEDFPPPPPPLDLSALEEYLPKPTLIEEEASPEPNSLLAQLQNKRQQILSHETEAQKIKTCPIQTSSVRSSGDTWLKELQAKQAALRIKKSGAVDNQIGVDEVNTQKYLPGEQKINSVKDLASKFEITEPSKPVPPVKPQDKPVTATINGLKPREIDGNVICPEQIAEELREVEMLSSAVNKVMNGNQDTSEENIRKIKVGKKKSVSFCDQVILVATAEEQEDDSYIPNPILERVLRSAMNKPEAAAIRQEILSLREQDGDVQLEKTPPQKPQMSVPLNDVAQPLYIRRNSLDNLLNSQNTSESSETCKYPTQNAGYNTQVVPQPNLNSGDVQVMPDQQYYGNYGTNGPVVPQNYQPPPPQSTNDINSQYQYNSHSQIHNNQSQQANGYYYARENQQPAVNGQYVRQSDIQQYKSYQTPHYGQNHQGYNGQQYQEHAPQQGHYGTVQQNGHYPEQNTPYRQSPYQVVPPNAAVHPGYRQMRSTPDYGNQTYSTSPRVPYNQPQIRQSTPSPMGYPFNHPPSPAPSTVSSNYNYHPAMYRNSPVNNNNNLNQVYQRVPMPNEYTQGYGYGETQYSRSPQEVHQRVPPPHGDDHGFQQGMKYPTYQQVPNPKQLLKKTVSFEPGTKGCESPTPKAIVTPIIVNNSNNSVPTDRTKCNLCRKKNVAASNLYCIDCEFYMSRFKPRS
ncbi:uncharacterized protein LOC115884005 isoform X2 [Sitophilus oryzae]|uniref:Uncharacterized protein LOC115884005 isoform X2 n=1 Tax=Sitophilus oryzae TaxID=7048 RepID=A0A6J2Y3B8_SITOR|nr:uncharacterized protein LOC115884005 isoform X2 [Sitophilus oryzae]